MSTEQDSEAKLLRIAQHYTGKSSIQALLNSTDFRNAMERAKGDKTLAIANLAIQRLKEQEVNCWFLGSYSGKTREGETYETNKVLLPDGSSRNVGSEALQLPFLYGVTVVGAEITNNIGTGNRSYRLGKEASIIGEHNEAPPEIGFRDALVEARAPRARGNKNLRANRVEDSFVSGKVFENEQRGIFIKDPSEDGPGNISFSVEDADGHIAQIPLSQDRFEHEFGFKPSENRDLAKDAIRGIEIRAFGELDVLARLPSDAEKQFQQQLVEIIRNKTKRTGEKQKLSLIEPVRVGPYTIQDLYEQKDGGGVVFQVDCQELGYTPSFKVEPRVVHGSGGEEYTFGRCYNIEFVGHEKGKAIIPSEYRGIGGLLDKYIDNQEISTQG